jgi:hypothetical protein
MVTKYVSKGAITLLAPTQSISEALNTHNFPPIPHIFGVQNNPNSFPLVHDHSICIEKLVRYVGVYSPAVVYRFVRICDSDLFSHVFQSTNQIHLTTVLR